MVSNSQVHTLKTRAPYWHAVKEGRKTFEVRRDDRGFQCGDTLELVLLDEERPSLPAFPNRVLIATVQYVLPGGQFGIQPGYVVMGLSHVREAADGE
jgi:hypothetical protein